MDATHDVFDVIIVGGGMVGAALGALLGEAHGLSLPESGPHGFEVTGACMACFECLG